MLGPVIEEVAKEYAGKVKVGKLNTDDHPNTPGKFRISAIPTILFFKGGQLVEQRVGVQSKADIKKLLDGLLA
jgi:thioredoxin 1